MQQRFSIVFVARLVAVLVALLVAGCPSEEPPVERPVCDGLRQNSERLIDDAFDVDRDGFYDAADAGCAATYGVEELDCDDADNDIHPGAAEAHCTGVDEDCDPATSDLIDEDGDGVEGCVADCDDDDPNNFPGNTEICDAQDNDCDASTPEGLDEDGDGYSALCAHDCDDHDTEVHPFLEEVCDGKDNDCDADTPEAADDDGDGVTGICGGDCDDDDPNNFPGNPEICDAQDNDCDEATQETGDADFDGASLICGGDCDDADGANRPGAPEVCDGQDNDCDPNTDENTDNDGDGVSLICGEDCDDFNPANFQGNTEVCDGQSNDCDAEIDEGTLGSHFDCPAPDCAAILVEQPGAISGAAWLDFGNGAIHGYCEQGIGGGGWTLVVTSSDDIAATWTWANRALLSTATNLVGSVTTPLVDFKSQALLDLRFSDVMARHGPSGVWAAYDDVGDGTTSLGEETDLAGQVCYGRAGAGGFPMTAGTLTVTGALCSTDLYLNAMDNEADSCASSGGAGGNDTWGIGWSADQGDGCALDDPALTSLGPDASQPGVEVPAAGFGAAIGANTGTPGSSQNHLQVFVR